MFIGHFGLGFAAKKLDKKPSLGILFISAQWIDLVWPFMLILGLEQVEVDPGNTAFTPLNFISYPFTHGLVSVLIWGALLGGLYYWIKKDGKGAMIVGMLVISHWILDFITHRPDLPLMFGSEAKVGLGLWNSIAGTVLLESAIFILGVFLYLKATRAANLKGTIGFWALVVFFVVIYVMNLFGPPPPSAEPIAYVGLAQWLFVVWAFWVDRNRTSA